MTTTVHHSRPLDGPELTAVTVDATGDTPLSAMRQAASERIGRPVRLASTSRLGADTFRAAFVAVAS